MMPQNPAGSCVEGQIRVSSQEAALLLGCGSGLHTITEKAEATPLRSIYTPYDPYEEIRINRVTALSEIHHDLYAQ